MSTRYEFCHDVSDTEVTCYVTIEHVTALDARTACPVGTSLAYIETRSEFNEVLDYLETCNIRV